MSFIVDYNITKFQINQDSVEVWKLLNRYIGFKLYTLELKIIYALQQFASILIKVL